LEAHFADSSNSEKWWKGRNMTLSHQNSLFYETNNWLGRNFINGAVSLVAITSAKTCFLVTILDKF